MADKFVTSTRPDTSIFIPEFNRDRDIDTLPISVRLYNSLKNFGITKIGQLHGRKWREIWNLPNVGKATVLELWAAIDWPNGSKPTQTENIMDESSLQKAQIASLTKGPSAAPKIDHSRQMLNELDLYLAGYDFDQDGEKQEVADARSADRFGWIIMNSGSQIGPFSRLIGFGSGTVDLSTHNDFGTYTHSILISQIAGVRYG